MENGLIAAVVLIVVTGVVLALKKKRRKSKVINKKRKHDSGLDLYHESTEVRVHLPLELSKKEDRVAVLEFKGDLRASERWSLSSLLDEVILNAEHFDELVLKVESPGGAVAEYGFVYAELERVRERAPKVRVTVCVDTVAASGGYLMSLPAHQILAAPFAMVGSIGVVSFVPNIRRLLQQLKIEPRTFTAGNYKRTVSLTDDASPEDVEHYKQQLALIHEQFKFALKKYRPGVEIDQVATGEAWLASSTVEKNLGLVDGLRVSSDYLMELNRSKSLVYLKKKTAQGGLLRSWLKKRVESSLASLRSEMDNGEHFLLKS
ncbi:MAG: S49 family peptidase [Bdellovibrionota bacterium]